ncbi:sensor histidine kinase KdpD [Leucobacter coleopterorum]|uniref:histidine kinase n=1 Tax=Leucobacter coleopterorum TaxID=2714933 RepID=A0ABX6JY40_9MICO|nr:sensor histidine kinase KdpD [Leucobacter coleopterorum]
MLEEGRRLVGEGKDVAIAIVETHGRAATAAMTEGLERLPMRRLGHRGIELEEMDLDAVLRRHPQLALVDELAHTNAPGTRNEKRWQDVEEMLEAGINVITTVNIQHIESLNDVVERITGIPQRETVPDEVLRNADQVEVIDLAPQALRDRLSDGYVYPAERIDAALSNYFRLGNLTALRELALVWLADEVDQALMRYRSEHNIDKTWEARERVVVSLAGGREGETLLRRAARIASRSSGGELIAVHIISPDGLRSTNPAAVAEQRRLVEQLGGTFHQVAGEDIPTALVEFARSVNATQLVLGVSRRSRIAALLTGPGIGATVIREAGDIDVHIVNHEAAGGGSLLPRIGGALSLKRRIAGFLLALSGGPLLTWALKAMHVPESITSEVLSYQLLVVVVALIGGIWPALFAALLSGFTLDYFFIDPRHTITISEPSHMIAVVLYVTIAILVSFIVDRAARQTRVARRAAAESEMLQTVAGSVLRGEEAIPALVERTRESFGLDYVRLVEPDRTLAESGTPAAPAVPPTNTVDLEDGATLEMYGSELQASERRLLAVIAAQLNAALEHSDLEDAASEVEPLAASDRVRSALLSALSHDLRRPLASASAAVGGLLSAGAALSERDREELLTTADESLQALAKLVTDLLDVSRLQAGVLGITLMPVDCSGVIATALDELEFGPDQVEISLDAEVSAVAADPVLLQRVIVNLLLNAARHSPPDKRPRITTSEFDHVVEIRIVDHGPGIPPERRDDAFVPFQRLGDTDNSTGLGLGLALSKGFIEGMGGQLQPEDTPGGGLTMVIALPEAGAGSIGDRGDGTGD